MTHISKTCRFYVLERLQDVSGISGTGYVAYVVDLGPADGVLMLWDTHVGEHHDIHTEGIEHLPNMALLRLIHCHQGLTVVKPVLDPELQIRAERLLNKAVPKLQAIATRFAPPHAEPAQAPAATP